MQNSIEAAALMSVEEWFETYGVAILKREEKKRRIAVLISGLKAKAATATKGCLIT
jgi:hypothetical protein